MNMNLFDWAMVGAILAVFIFIAMSANRLTKSVADFLVAGRSAGRYVLTVSAGTEWIGVIAIAAMFEVYFKGGLPCMWWVMLASPLIAYLQISGFGMYRFRETRAMTVAEYLERRYSRGTRLLGATISWIAGMVNFGFFPLIGAKFFMALIGLPASFELMGMDVPTYPVITAVVVILPLMFVLFGGHMTVLVSDFAQGLFMNLAALALVFTVLSSVFHWDEVVFSLKHAATGPQASLINPMHTAEIGDFSPWYFLLGILTAYYSIMSNVAAQGFQGSAKNAHELRMGNLLGQIRWQGLLIFFMVFAMVALTYMNHPAHTVTRDAINQSLDATLGSTELTAERTQMLVPAALSHMLPHGMIGIFCAMMVAALIASSNAFMHAWGSVLLQDLVLPFRKVPLTNKSHLWALRGSVLGVALIAFVLSLTIKPQQSILMYFALFNNLWLGPAGAVILGGLYWKRGTTAAAITTFITGAVVGLTMIVISQGWKTWTGKDFPVNGQYVYVLTIALCILIYVGISLIFPKPDHDMDKLLHRGKHAIASDHVTVFDRAVPLWQRAFGITRMFSREDRVTAYLVIGYFLLSLAVFLAGMLIGWIGNPTDDDWMKFWAIFLIGQLALLVGSTLWLGIGGIRDLRRLFREMKTSPHETRETGELVHESAAPDSTP